MHLQLFAESGQWEDQAIQHLACPPPKIWRCLHAWKLGFCLPRAGAECSWACSSAAVDASCIYWQLVLAPRLLLWLWMSTHCCDFTDTRL